jgi:hypothetical protein
MPSYLFRWTSEIEEHLAEHGVTPGEFEEVVLDPDDTDVSKRSGLHVAFGTTSTGKYIACVYDEFQGWIYPTTAYEIESSR